MSITTTTNLFQNLMIDPPWQKSKGGRRKARPKQARAFDYPTMGFDDIFRLLDDEIFPLASPTHNVFLWVIDSYLCAAETVMLGRGYKRHARLVWNKGNGIAPAFTVRYAHEYLIWYYKPKLLPIDKSQRGKWTTVLVEPARQHSRKPDIAYEFVRSLYPHSPCIDVFSREPREGWSQWGNQTDHFAA